MPNRRSASRRARASTECVPPFSSYARVWRHTLARWRRPGYGTAACAELPPHGCGRAGAARSATSERGGRTGLATTRRPRRRPRRGLLGGHQRVLALVEAVGLDVARPVRVEDEARAEADEPAERERDLGEQGAAVLQVGPERLHRLDRVGVRRLGHEQATRPQPAQAELEEPGQLVELESGQDARGEDRPERALGAALEVLERRRELDLVPALPCPCRGVGTCP